MKTTFVIGMVLIALTGCEKLAELTKFTLPYDSSVTINSTVGIDLPFDVLTPEISSNSESAFAVNNTRKDLIEEIKLTVLELEVVEPTDGDFSFLKSIDVYIDADGLPEVEIASSGSVSNSVGNMLSLTTTDADLKEYIKKDEFSLRVNVVTDELISEDHEISIHCEFFVDARVLGL